MSQASLFAEEGGPWRVEVWVPVGRAWVPVDRIESSGARDVGDWTFESFDEALEAAFGWMELGTVIDPTARVWDLALGAPAWESCGPTGPSSTVKVSERYL